MITIGRRTMPSACASLISKRLLRKCSTAFHLAEPSALSCSPVKYKHQFQRDTRRSFSAWQKMTDVLFQRSNPILDAVQPISGSDEKKAIETLPDFGSIQMHHLEAAAKQAQADYDAALTELEQTISNWPTGIPEYSDVVPQLQRIETPLNSVRRIFQLYWTVQQDPITQIACTKAFNALNSRRQTSKIIQGALKSIESAMKEVKNNNNSELSRQRLLAVQVLLGECTRKGMDLDIDQTASDNDNYNDNPNVLEDLGSEIEIYESKFASNEGDYTKQKGTWTTREKIEDIYYLLALKKQKAKLLGFDNYVDMVLASQFRMASSSNQIKQLYKEVTPKLLSIVSSPPTNSQSDQEIDLRSYLTLDGVLGGMFGLSRALFGLVIREEKDEEK